jgi:DNA-binding LacI/PurR family transcriptional regulator
MSHRCGWATGGRTVQEEPGLGKASDQRVGIADVAREAGVSKSAVSFAFNSPDRLSVETATRIRDVADRMGYRPHPVARMLSAGHTTTIGILSPQALGQVFANPFFALFAEGVASVTEQHGFGLLLISPLHGSLARALERATVDGVVALGLDERHPELGSIRLAGLPVVVVDSPAWTGHGAVLVDDEGGARLAAEHVLGLGHRDILVLGVEPAVGETDDEGMAGRRLAGYYTAFEAAGVALSQERIVRPPATIEGGEAAFFRVWSRGDRPTAVLCMSDAAAAGALAAARRLGVRVPEELSIVGFDDLPLTRFTDPPLTTVHQPVRRKGEAAASMLLEALRRPSAHDLDRVLVLETRLVVRRSTAAPSGDRSQEVVVAR